jgi:hypothetical protein
MGQPHFSNLFLQANTIWGGRFSILTYLPGVLHHSVKLRISTQGYIAERACREKPLELAGMMTSPMH